METLYTIVQIDKMLENFKETRKYYIIKDEAYGVKITKTLNNDMVEKEILSIKNVITTEKSIKELIDKVILCDENYDLILEIVEEYAKNQISISIEGMEKRTNN